MKRRKLPPLEVHRVFDPNRLAASVLEDAYRHLVPVIHRATTRRLEPMREDRPQARRQGGAHR